VPVESPAAAEAQHEASGGVGEAALAGA
jgi:hypothetical protein